MDAKILSKIVAKQIQQCTKKIESKTGKIKTRKNKNTHTHKWKINMTTLELSQECEVNLKLEIIM